MFKRNIRMLSFLVITQFIFNAYAMENQEIIKRYSVVEDITPEYIPYSQRTKSPMEDYIIVCILYTKGILAGKKICFRSDKKNNVEQVNNAWFRILKKVYEKEQMEQNQTKEK